MFLLCPIMTFPIKKYFSEVQDNLNKVTNLELDEDEKKIESINKKKDEQKK